MKIQEWLLLLFLPITLLSCTKAPNIVKESPIAELPCPNSYSIAPFQTKHLIVIDPGHGGKDLGSEAAIRMTEKELNLKTAKYVVSILRQMGYQVAITRNSDYFVPLLKRAAFANTNKADLFVSIHFNSAPSASAEGIEVFYYKADANRTRVNASLRLGQEVLSKLIAETGAKSRGVKEGNLAVIRETSMPAILIEGGFLTHPKERERILENAYQKRIAKGIAMGVREYLQVSNVH